MKGYNQLCCKHCVTVSIEEQQNDCLFLFLHITKLFVTFFKIQAALVSGNVQKFYFYQYPLC